MNHCHPSRSPCLDWSDASRAVAEMFQAQVVERPDRPVADVIAELFDLPTVAAENAALLAGERAVASATPAVAALGRNVRTWRVKVAHADRPTANRRLYPRATLAQAVARANAEQCPQGALGGAADHAGPLDGGNLKNRCVIWRDLAMEADGSVYGSFEIVEGHTDGANLLAWVKAGGALGFSTSGRAKARKPTADECRRYGLTEGDGTVIMESFRLDGIDVVDRPAVDDAVLPGRRHQ